MVVKTLSIPAKNRVESTEDTRMVRFIWDTTLAESGAGLEPQWSSFRITLKNHSRKRIHIKDISKLGKNGLSPLPAALGEADNKSNNKSLFLTLQTEREREQHIFTSPLEFDHEFVDTPHWNS